MVQYTIEVPKAGSDIEVYENFEVLIWLFTDNGMALLQMSLLSMEVCCRTNYSEIVFDDLHYLLFREEQSYRSRLLPFRD